VPLLFLRHARAVERDEWEDDDRLRPLDERGRAQAAHLVEQLARFPVDRILSSPYVRCVQTVEPLAEARGLPVEQRDELGEEWQHQGGVELVRSLAGRDVVVCGHGGLELAVLPEPPRWKKGATFVLGPQLELLETLRA
jgi:phosphohistidine phosphatase SixA